MPKKEKPKLSAVERLQELSLLNKVTETLKEPLKGLEDKTLSEFLLNLVESEIHKVAKKKAKAGNNSYALSTSDTLNLAQSLQGQLPTQLPLSACTTLIELVERESPNYMRACEKLRKTLKVTCVFKE